MEVSVINGVTPFCYYYCCEISQVSQICALTKTKILGKTRFGSPDSSRPSPMELYHQINPVGINYLNAYPQNVDKKTCFLTPPLPAPRGQQIWNFWNIFDIGIKCILGNLGKISKKKSKKKSKDLYCLEMPRKSL